MGGKLRHGLRPAYGIQIGPVGGDGYIRRLPFRRAWLPILILLAMDLAFLVPAVTTFRQATAEWGRFEDLFDLVTALFLSAWLLGWSIAPLLLTTILALMMFGRETLRAQSGKLEIVIGLPGIGIRASYDSRYLRNLRLETPPKKSGKSWRGPHAAFDYGANPVEFGSDLDPVGLSELRRGIEQATGQTIPTRDPRPEEVSGDWKPASTAALLAASESPQPARPAAPVGVVSPSSLVLVLANLVPVVGAVFWNWDLGNVLVLYWAESAVIGFYNLCKIAVIAKWFALLAGVFFISHFGAFMAVHFLFLYGIFVEGFSSPSGGDLGEVAAMFGRLWPAIACLFLSHGFSFFANFIGREEYRGRNVRQQMTEPYARIIFMHLVVIFGGGAALILGDTIPVLLAIIAAKLWVDLRAHLRERGVA